MNIRNDVIWLGTERIEKNQNGELNVTKWGKKKEKTQDIFLCVFALHSLEQWKQKKIE